MSLVWVKLLNFGILTTLTVCVSCSTDSHLYHSFQGVMSENSTERLGLDYQRMIRIHQMLYIAARSHSLFIYPAFTLKERDSVYE